MDRKTIDIEKKIFHFLNFDQWQHEYMECTRSNFSTNLSINFLITNKNKIQTLTKNYRNQ